MSSNNNSSSAGIGFWGLLTIAFIVLKLTKTIAWSWSWVFAPIWVPGAITILVFVVLLVREIVLILKRRAE